MFSCMQPSSRQPSGQPSRQPSGQPSSSVDGKKGSVRRLDSWIGHLLREEKMPGLFGWSPRRILGRKTPESERQELLSTNDHRINCFRPARQVHFDDGVVVGRGNEKPWRYAIDDDSEQYRSTTTTTIDQERGASMLLRDMREVEQERSRKSLASMGVVFLQVNEEVKRSLLPSPLHSLNQVKAMFLRLFPHLTPQYLDLPYVKIYIQEPQRGHLFYEIDDIRDIKDRSVLKVREQISTSGFQSPQPVRFIDHLPLHSPSELDHHSYHQHQHQHQHRSSIDYHRRPASAVPGDNRSMFSNNNHVNNKAQSRLRSPFELSDYYNNNNNNNMNNSDAESARSGSATPIIDREARERMEFMERQLAGLSNLVHSALVTRGMDESTHRDLDDLRRHIMDNMHNKADSESVSSSAEPPSLPESLPTDNSQQLKHLKVKCGNVHQELGQLKRLVQLNSQSSRELLKEQFDKIQHLLVTKLPISVTNTKPHTMTNKDQWTTEIDKQTTEHSVELNAIQTALQCFESDVDSLRRSVLQSQKKLRMTEVEALTHTLTQIGRNAAAMKTRFPTLQRQIQAKISEDMETIIRGERFIKEESQQLDLALRRCKKLTNIMVTMKKLVQDPALNNSLHRPPSSPAFPPRPSPIPPAPPPPPPKPSAIAPPIAQKATLIDPTALNHRMDSTGLNSRIDPTALNNRMDSTAMNNRMDSTGLNNRIDPTAMNNRMDSTAMNNRIDSTVLNNRIDYVSNPLVLDNLLDDLNSTIRSLPSSNHHHQESIAYIDEKEHVPVSNERVETRPTKYTAEDVAALRRALSPTTTTTNGENNQGEHQNSDRSPSGILNRNDAIDERQMQLTAKQKQLHEQFVQLQQRGIIEK